MSRGSVIDGACIKPPAGAWANGNGYYRLTVSGVRVYAHRYAYEQALGAVPDGLVLDHLCRNRWCCNPHHLEPVTDEENKMRGVSPPAVNARKPHCPKGHPYEVQADGSRRCPTCRYVRRVATGDTSGIGRPADRTHCRYGHPYDESNTYLARRKDGSIKQRMCRECMRLRNRARRAAAKGGDA
jgi:hypothetical protein